MFSLTRSGSLRSRLMSSMVTYPPLCFFPVSPGKKKKPPVPAWDDGPALPPGLPRPGERDHSCAVRERRPQTPRLPLGEWSHRSGHRLAPSGGSLTRRKRIVFPSCGNYVRLVLYTRPRTFGKGEKRPNLPRLKKREPPFLRPLPSCRLSLYLPSRISLRMSSTRAAMLGVVFRFFSTVLQA